MRLRAARVEQHGARVQREDLRRNIRPLARQQASPSEPGIRDHAVELQRPASRGAPSRYQAFRRQGNEPAPHNLPLVHLRIRETETRIGSRKAGIEPHRTFILF